VASDDVTGGVSGAGASLSGVVDGGPAAVAGLTDGDTITALNGTTITSAQALTQALSTLTPGQSVSVTWTDVEGASHTADV
ncbi:PDZ domain-containing protein, partial [Brevibacillus sp. SIMBA_076]